MNMKKITYILIPALTFLYILVNLILIKTGSPLCQTSGCSATKTVLSIDSIYLYYMGLLGSLFLFFNGFLYLKTPMEYTKKFFIATLIMMVSAETVFLLYLFLKTGEMCILCLGFYILLNINLIFVSLQEKELVKYNPIIFILPVVISLVALDVRIQPDKVTSKYTLLVSDTCKYCKNLKEYMNKENIQYNQEDYTKYMALFKTFGMNKIPVLIVNDLTANTSNGDPKISVIEGVADIKSYLISKSKKDILIENNDVFNKVESSSLLNSSNSSFMEALGNPLDQPLDGGCSIEKKEVKEDCD